MLLGMELGRGDLSKALICTVHDLAGAGAFAGQFDATRAAVGGVDGTLEEAAALEAVDDARERGCALPCLRNELAHAARLVLLEARERVGLGGGQPEFFEFDLEAPIELGAAPLEGRSS